MFGVDINRYELFDNNISTSVRERLIWMKTNTQVITYNKNILVEHR